MVSDGLEHLSKKTRERAFILARNARSIGLPLGAVRFTPNYDFMSYYLTNGSAYMIVFCIPEGYLAEWWQESEGYVSPDFFAIKNIRHFLQVLKKQDYKDVEEVFNSDDDDDDITEYLKDQEDDN